MYRNNIGKGIFIIFILIITIYKHSFYAHAASFNCNEAKTKTEKMICSDAELSLMDSEMEKAYFTAKQRCGDSKKSNLVAAQKRWIKDKQNVCESTACLKSAYLERLAELRAINAPQGNLKISPLKTTNDFCGDVEKILSSQLAMKATNSRALTKDEDEILHKANMDIFDLPADYASGVEILDIDNDRKQEVFAYNISGTGRIATMAAFTLPTLKANAEPIRQLFSDSAGIMEKPYFIHTNGKNYLITTGDGDNESFRTVSEIKRSAKSYQQIIRCVEKANISKKRQCNDIACKALEQRIIKNQDQEFTAEIWPHKYMAPFGIKVFVHDNPIAVDYDNSGIIHYLWKIGRQNYAYANIYWSWMGEGTKNKAPSAIPPVFDSNNPRDVMAGDEHNHLRNVMKQHAELLRKNNILKSTETLPRNGEFFFLNSGGLKYWVWSVGDDAAYGDTLHVILTKGGVSKYIGAVELKKSVHLVSCKSKCVRALEQ